MPGSLTCHFCFQRADQYFSRAVRYCDSYTEIAVIRNNRTWMGEKSLIDIKLDETDVDRLRETRMQNPV